MEINDTPRLQGNREFDVNALAGERSILAPAGIYCLDGRVP